MILARLLIGWILAGMGVAHGGGLLVLVLGMLVEGADLEKILNTLPQAWAALAAPFSLLGGVLAAARALGNGSILGLGSMGISPRKLALTGMLVGALVGIPAGLLQKKPPEASDSWERVVGGWVRAGEVWVDPGRELIRIEKTTVSGFSMAGELAAGAGSVAFGVLLGLQGGVLQTLLTTSLLLIGQTVIRGLVERSILSEGWFLAIGAGLLVGARLWEKWGPLFPGRSR
jgi:hypothetical protein